MPSPPAGGGSDQSWQNVIGERDLVCKRAQYAARCIPEYWLVDPDAETVTVLGWEDGDYNPIQTAKEDAIITSQEFPDLQLTVNQLFWW